MSQRRSRDSLVHPVIDSDLPPPISVERRDDRVGRYSLVVPRSPQRARRPLTVLIVEADPSIARFMIDVLSVAGHAPLHAPSLSVAQERLAQGRPDLVMLDLELDGDSTLDVLSELVRETEPPAIVVVSASRLAEAIAREHQAGFVRKPFAIDELMRVVDHVTADRAPIAP